MRIAPSSLVLAPAAVAFAFALAACSSSSSSGGSSQPTTFDSGISSSKLVDDLNDAEVTQFCQSGRDYGARVYASLDPKQLSCNIEGLVSASMASTDAEAQAQCKAAHDKCIAAGKPPTTDPSSTPEKPCDATDQSSLKAACAGKGVTVGDVSGCAMETNAAFASLAAPTYCDGAKLSSSPMTSLYKGAACTALLKKCPNAFGAATAQ